MRMPSALVATRAGVIALGLSLLGVAGDKKPAILWERALDGDVYGSALASDTVVLLTLEPRASRWTIEAHDARSGTLRWRRAAPGTSLGPAVGGSIILDGRDGIGALEAASGAERWHFARPVVETNAHDGALGGFSSPALLDGECLYAADYVPSPAKKDAVGESTLYCLSPAEGVARWSTKIPTGTIGPSLASNADVVLVIREYGASAVDKAAHRVRWSIDFNSVRAPRGPRTRRRVPARARASGRVAEGWLHAVGEAGRSRRLRSHVPGRRVVRAPRAARGSGRFPGRYARRRIPRTASTSSAGTATSMPWIGATVRPAGAFVSTSAIGRRRPWSGRID